jgi:hypothetical protein
LKEYYIKNRVTSDPAAELEFIHYLASTDQALAKAAEFNSEQQGSRYRSAEFHLLRAHHSSLAE